MEYVFSILASVAATVLAFVLKSVITENRELKRVHNENEEKKASALEEGVKCMLRDTLIDKHMKFTQQTYISTHGLQNWLAMYNAYKGLGGNGMIDHMKDEIEELPIR